MYSTIADLQGRHDLQLITDSQDVAPIKDYFQGAALECDGFFVAVKDGDYTECYGFSGIVPFLHKPLVLLLSPFDR